MEVQGSSDRQESSEPKKRGRPPMLRNRQKNTKMPQQQRRVSLRIKSIRKSVECTTRPQRNVWSNLEKHQLMEGLEQYGKDNIQGIKEYVRNRTDKEIKNQIKKWEDFAREELKKKSLLKQKKKKKNWSKSEIMLANLDKWLEYFKSETDTSCPSLFALSNALLLIAEYGKIPPPEECDQIDFRAFYRMLHCMINGTPFYGLNQATAKFIESTFSILTKKLNTASCVKRLKPHLLNCTPPKPAIKNYGRPPYRGIHAPQNGQSVLEMPGMNPLNLPLAALEPIKMRGLNISGVEEVESSQVECSEVEFSEEESSEEESSEVESSEEESSEESLSSDDE